MSEQYECKQIVPPSVTKSRDIIVTVRDRKSRKLNRSSPDIDISIKT